MGGYIYKKENGISFNELVRVLGIQLDGLTSLGRKLSLLLEKRKNKEEGEGDLYILMESSW